MSNRITTKDLEDMVEYINGVLNPILEHHLYWANGGVKLLRANGADALSTGCIPKRDLYNRMAAYIKGIQL